MGQGTSLLAFDSLPHQAALVNSDGVIVAVNAAWRAFAESNGASRELKEGVGLDYLSVCRHATGPDADEAPLAAASIEGGLTGSHPQSTFFYPCHSRTESRWFLCATHSYDFSAAQRCVLISHVRLVDAHLAHARTPRLQAADSGPTSLACELLQSQTMTGWWELDPDLRHLRWSRESYRILGMSPDAGPATFRSMLGVYNSKDRRRLQSLFLQLAHFGVPFDVELRALTPDKERKRVLLTGRATTSGAKVALLYGLIRDITPAGSVSVGVRSTLDA